MPCKRNSKELGSHQEINLFMWHLGPDAMDKTQRNLYLFVTNSVFCVYLLITVSVYADT